MTPNPSNPQNIHPQQMRDEARRADVFHWLFGKQQTKWTLYATRKRDDNGNRILSLRRHHVDDWQYDFELRRLLPSSQTLVLYCNGVKISNPIPLHEIARYGGELNSGYFRKYLRPQPGEPDPDASVPFDEGTVTGRYTGKAPEFTILDDPMATLMFEMDERGNIKVVERSRSPASSRGIEIKKFVAEMDRMKAMLMMKKETSF